MGTNQPAQDWTFTVGDESYDLQNAAQMRQVLSCMLENQVNLQTQLNQQPAPPPIAQQTGLTNAQIQALATAINPQRTFTAPMNPAYPTLNIPYEDNVPPAGIEDVKANLPSPFSGKRPDAERFLVQFEAYIAQRPKNMRLTRTRILVFCSLLQNGSAASWARNVEEAITTHNGTSSFYYDNWARFKIDFTNHFGILNKEADAMNKFQHLVQGNVEWTTFFTEFDQLRAKAGLTEDQSFYQIRKATNEALRNALMNSENPPLSYSQWNLRAKARTDQARMIKDFNSNHLFTPTTLHRNTTSHQTAYDAKHVVPMQIDALGHQQGRKDKNKKRTKPSPHQSLPNSKASQKKPFVPSRSPFPPGVVGIPTTSTSPVKSGTNRPLPMRSIGCFRCGKPGHMARECTTPINQIEEHRINALMEIACATSDNPQEDEIPTGENPLPDQESSEEDNDDDVQQDGDLISFDEEEKDF